MSKKKSRKLIEELMDDCASANECTGLYQKVSLDPAEVAEFHEIYNKENEDKSTK